MKFATLSSGQVVAGTKDGYRIVNNRKSMIDVIENPSGLTFSGDPMELPEKLSPPVPKPSKIWAAAGNFYRGVNVKDPDGKSSRGAATTLTKEELLHSIFLKPPSAIIGPGDSVVIPPGAERGVFPEVELCIVIGKRSRNLTVEQAPVGYFWLLHPARYHRAQLRPREIGQDDALRPQGLRNLRAVRAGHHHA